MDYCLENLFKDHFLKFDELNSVDSPIINQYLTNLLIKYNNKYNDMYIYETFLEINQEDNIFKRKSKLQELSDYLIFSLGITPFYLDKKIPNFNYYRDNLKLSYIELKKLAKNNLIYTLMIKNLNYTLLKLNYTSIKIFLSEEEIEVLKFKISQKENTHFINFLKFNKINKFI